MTYDPRGLSFKGCKTRAEVIDRMGAWLDAHYDEQVRTVAACWLVDDGAECDAAAFQSELAQLRAAFTRSRADCLAAVTRALDEAGRP